MTPKTSGSFLRKEVYKTVFSWKTSKTVLLALSLFRPCDVLLRSKDKTLNLFGSYDRMKAYEEAMTGKLDDMKFSKCESKEAENLLKEHQEIGRKVGGTGTPLFLIDGQAVLGADIALIEKILEGKRQ